MRWPFHRYCLRYPMRMEKAHFVEAAIACLSNGERLLEDAKWYIPEEHPGTSFALATIAQEEFAKAFFLFLASRDVIAWNSLILRATRDHACKQLLGLVMSHLNPEWEQFERRAKGWLAEHKEWERLMAEYKSAADRHERARIWNLIQELNEMHGRLPDSVADAINILRYEKIGRWESSHWFWEEEPVYDTIAKGLAEGKLDNENQNALYIRLGPNGGLAKIPNEVKGGEAKTAVEAAERLASLVEGLLSGNTANSIEYEKVESAFRLVFGTLSREQS